jgi:PTS system ascorbate-specific IIB component
MKRNDLTIMTVCGAGVGSSVLLRANILKLLDKYGIKAQVITADPLTAKGQKADIIVTQEAFKKSLEGTQARKIIFLKNLVSSKELEEKLIPAVKEIISQ